MTDCWRETPHPWRWSGLLPQRWRFRSRMTGSARPRAARHIAASVKGAELMIYSAGGHVWVGHDDEVFAAVATFLNAL